MKFELMSSRETTLDHCKRGISWHGFCIEFYLLEDKEHDDSNITTKELKRYVVCIDWLRKNYK